MIILILGLLLALSFIFYQKYFIFSLMIFFLLFDMFDGFYKDFKVFAAIRYILPLAFIVIYVVKNRALKNEDFVFFIFTISLFLFLFLNHGDFILSGKVTLSIIISVSLLLVGRYLGNKINFVKEYEPFNTFMLAIVPVYIIYANVFKVGDSYSSSFSTGFLDTSRMYIVPILIFMAFHYILNPDKFPGTKLSYIFKGSLIGLNTLILVVTTRRTSLGMLVGAILVYSLLNRKVIFKMMMVIVFLLVGAIATFPLYQDRLNAQLEERERIQNIDTYTKEGRYLESLYLYQFHSQLQDPKKLFLGVKMFDTESFGLRYFGVGRHIHSDINMIIYSTGLVGLMLFIVFFSFYLWRGNNRIDSESKKLFFPLLFMFLFVLLPGRFIGTFTYGPLLMLLIAGIKHTNYNKPIYKLIRSNRLVQSQKIKTRLLTSS